MKVQRKGFFKFIFNPLNRNSFYFTQKRVYAVKEFNRVKKKNL